MLSCQFIIHVPYLSINIAIVYDYVWTFLSLRSVYDLYRSWLNLRVCQGQSAAAILFSYPKKLVVAFRKLGCVSIRINTLVSLFLVNCSMVVIIIIFRRKMMKDLVEYHTYNKTISIGDDLLVRQFFTKAKIEHV